MSISAIRNHILFRFKDNVNAKGQFDEEKSAGGIIIQGTFDSSAKSSRWVTIVSLGPDCSDELRGEGCELLIENLKWTPGVTCEGEMIWRTDENMVLLYRYPDENGVYSNSF